MESRSRPPRNGSERTLFCRSAWRISSVAKRVGLLLQQERWRQQSNAAQGCCDLANPRGRKQQVRVWQLTAQERTTLSTDAGAVRGEGQMSASSVLLTPRQTGRSDATFHSGKIAIPFAAFPLRASEIVPCFE